MPDYPATLPQPDDVNYSGVVDHATIRTPVSTALGNQRTGFNAASNRITLQFSMQNSTYLEWETWVSANAWTWFDMDLVNPNSPVDVTSRQTVRFASPIRYTKRGDNWLSVSVTLELLQAQAADPLAPANPV